MKTKPYLLGISGGSASGKTFLIRRMLDQFTRDQVTLISQDNYYRKREVLPRNEKGEINFDHPDSVDMEALSQDIRRLAAGESITVEEYTFNNPAVVPKMITYHPAQVIIIEGLFVFYHESLAQQMDLKVFVDADEHIKLSRRIKRDFAERGYDLEQVLYYYEAYVIPMYKKFVEPTKEGCDIILPNNLHMEKSTEILIHHVEKILSKG
jgi:uridine kinase